VAETSCASPAIPLPGNASRAGLCAHCTARQTLTVVQKVPCLERSVLFVSQFDVANPQAHGRLRNPEQLGDLLDRTPLVATHRPCPFSLDCFHF